MEKNELLFNELNEENLESMIYEIRGERVMLDFDLARIYGYETRRFNEQVKRNKSKFPNDFMFKLTSIELNYLAMSQKATAQIWTVGNQGGRTAFTYAFTEKGIYMLMKCLSLQTYSPIKKLSHNL